MMSLVAKIVMIHEVLANADLPHAFGGALALAWCTSRARGTIDIDVNVFIPGSDYDRVLLTLPDEITITQKDRALFRKEGQVRLWWEKTPLDLFLNTTDYHKQIAGRIRWEKFGGTSVPFLCCNDLAVFKAFFNRTKDWADLEEMQSAGTINIAEVISTISLYLGNEHERIPRLRALASLD